MLSKKEIKIIKERYPIGTRIKLDYMDDAFGVPSGTYGTVEMVDDAGQIYVKWDNGRNLALIVGVDSLKIEK